MSHNAIKSIVIAGGGMAGWMAAALLSKALGSNVNITLIESAQIATIGVGEATIPQIQHVNRFLSINEAEFVKATKASFKLGIQFNNWGRVGESYIHAFGDIGLPLGMAPFHHYWMRSCQESLDKPLWHYSINAQAARQNKFQPLERVGQSRITGTRYAYHFDASLYAAYLRSLSEKAGVTRIEDTIVDVALNQTNGFLSELILQSGKRQKADLFIDCTGFHARLITGAMETPYENWQDYLPCNRAAVAASSHNGPFRPYTQSTAQKAGWQWRIPLQHRVGNGHVYCHEFISDDEAIASLLENIEGEALSDPRIIRFTTGMRREIWVKNCVALGLAAGFMEPLESTSIHLVQTGINRLISLFPDLNFDPALLKSYNEQTRQEYLYIRDFLMLHYVANHKDDLPFWRYCQNLPLSDALKYKMDMFRSSARINRDEGDLFSEVGWLQVLLGQNITPHSYHPLADNLPQNKIDEALLNIDRLIQSAVSKMPTHRDFIKTNFASEDFIG